ncbi:MAG TPA: glycosyltransferase family 1 protein [Candidatus Paceibacterota bacterium]|nr:glycosyltransferase family 1 protein [Candidatus Paceibacterota bacterium]
MKIGIAVNISLERRTGVEEYVYNLLMNFPMLEESKEHRILIYSPNNLKWSFKKLWTQIRLSWEMFKNPPDVLFVPAHTFPLIHPKLVITIQGLEFEKLPKMYPFFKRLFLRWMTKRNIKKADRIIVPSQNTKDDLIKFYHADTNKIFVIHHGIGNPEVALDATQTAFDIAQTNKFIPYLLCLGRGDQRKNIQGLIKAFKILKQDHQIPHKLILAGPNIGYKIYKNLKDDVICTGYVDDNKKWSLLKNADVFIFPSFCEGFGIPVLEAQKVGTPVVAASTSSFPEILGDSALLVNPYHPTEIAEAIHKIIRNQNFSDELIKRGYENVQRFSWLKCAKETLEIIINA